MLKLAKLLTILTIILFSAKGMAQDPEPELFRTWYLKYLQVTDMATVFDIAEIVPPIQPFITIEQDLTYAGQGACNSFTGTFFLPFPGALQSSDWQDTGQDCGVTVHNLFEMDYFSYLQVGGEYQIEQDGQGFTLTISTPIFGIAIFNDYPLSVDENTLNQISLFPNPVRDRLRVVDQLQTLTGLRVYDASGRLLLENSGSIEELDLTDCASGTLFVELVNTKGVITKKIIKI